MKAKKQNDTLYLIPGTDLVASNVEAQRNDMAEKIHKNSGVSRVVLDVHGVDIVDSLGVNLIIGLYREVSSGSKTFEIIGGSEKFMKVANFFRFPSLFTVRSAEESA
jgi:anti-anti-sigma factor